MRKGVRFRSDMEPIERRTIAPAPCDKPQASVIAVVSTRPTSTSDVSCERTFFTRVLDMAAIVLVEDKSVSAGGGDNGER
jgi:hypothetical protein